MVIVTDRVPKIGEILMKDGVIDRVQIELALEEQKRTGDPIGEILVARHYVTSDQLRHALFEQFRMQVLAGVVSVAIGLGSPLEALAQSTGTLILRGVVPPVATIELSQARAEIPGDLRIPHSGDLITVTEKSNVPFGYHVTIQSETAARHGEPALENPQTNQVVPYKLTYGGKDVVFRNGNGLLTDTSRPAVRSVEKTLSVVTNPGSQLKGGTYSDVLTFTITYNK